MVSKDGTSIDVKRALPVSSASGVAEAGYGLGDERVSKKKDELVSMMALIYAWMDVGERKSVASAAIHVKKIMGAEYKNTLAKVGFGSSLGALARAIRLFTNEFEVETSGYYFRRL